MSGSNSLVGVLLLFAIAAMILSLLWGSVVAPALATVEGLDSNSLTAVNLSTKNGKQQLPVINPDYEAQHADMLAALGDIDHRQAAEIRKCYDEGNTYQVWREPDGKTFHCLVQLPDGKMGDRLITKDKTIQQWVEKSTFCPKGGCWQKIIQWLERKGATRFGGDVQ